MASPAESAFLRQFGYRTSTEKPSTSENVATTKNGNELVDNKKNVGISVAADIDDDSKLRTTAAPKTSSKRKRKTKKTKKEKSKEQRKLHCSCECSYCGDPSKRQPPIETGNCEEDDEKSTIGGGLTPNSYGASTANLSEEDWAVKMKTNRSGAAVDCPQCFTRLRLELGTHGGASTKTTMDDRSIDLNDSLYELKDTSYKGWSSEQPDNANDNEAFNW